MSSCFPIVKTTLSLLVEVLPIDLDCFGVSCLDLDIGCSDVCVLLKYKTLYTVKRHARLEEMLVIRFLSYTFELLKHYPGI